MTFQSEEEAHEALEETRKELIDAAEAIAIEILDNGIAKGGRPAVHSQMVESVMVKRGLVDVDDPRSRRWMGAVFKRKGWVKLAVVKAGNTHRNNHASWRGLWTRDGYPIPDGMSREEVCIVCGRGERDRPKLTTLRRALDALRTVHRGSRSRLKKKQDDDLNELGRWISKVIERGE